MDTQRLKVIVEAALLAAARPVSLEQLEKLFPEGESNPGRDALRAALDVLHTDCVGRGYELKHVASGYRFQVRQDLQPWVARLWDEKPPRYSRALLETLALIAYRQPLTRSEIEEVRGVTVSTNIMRTLLDREWVRVLGHRDLPGKPAMYGTTREFLNYFNLKSLDELPTLAELASLDQVHPQLDLEADAPVEGGEQQDAEGGEDQGPDSETESQDVSEVDAQEHSDEPEPEDVDSAGGDGDAAEVVDIDAQPEAEREGRLPADTDDRQS